MDAGLTLFSRLSMLTMFHGVVLGGGALLLLAAGLFYLTVVPAGAGTPRQERAFSWLLAGLALVLWFAVIGGTYLVFPPYRVTPPEGVTDLAAYPRSFLLANPSTAWLHAFAMEIKEHVPWSAAMLSTAVAFVGMKGGGAGLQDRDNRRVAGVLLWICFALTALMALLGTFINKVAPLE